MNENYLMIYTDGSCNRQTKYGGIGIYMEYKSPSKSIIATKTYRIGYCDTTISRMEMRAILTAMRQVVNKHVKTVIVSDSAVCINAFNKGWVHRWKSEGWFNRPNADLWRAMLCEVLKFKDLTLLHTRGHGKGKESYVYGNEMADKLAAYKQFENYLEDKEEDCCEL